MTNDIYFLKRHLSDSLLEIVNVSGLEVESTPKGISGCRVTT